MAQNTMHADRLHEMLSWVREGTPVFDRHQRKIGKVRYVHQGDAADPGLIYKPPEFYRMEPAVQIRMAQDGFVQIDCGFLARDRFAVLEQIANVDDEGLHLTSDRNELIAV